MLEHDPQSKRVQLAPNRGNRGMRLVVGLAVVLLAGLIWAASLNPADAPPIAQQPTPTQSPVQPPTPRPTPQPQALPPDDDLYLVVRQPDRLEPNALGERVLAFGARDLFDARYSVGGRGAEAALSPDGTRLYLATTTALFAFDAASGEQQWRTPLTTTLLLQSPADGVDRTPLLPSPDGERLYVLSLDPRSNGVRQYYLTIVDAHTGTILPQQIVIPYRLNLGIFAVAADSRTIYHVSPVRTITTFDVATGAATTSPFVPGTLALTLAPYSTRLYGISQRGQTVSVYWVDVTDPLLITTSVLTLRDADVRAGTPLTVSPDGTTLAITVEQRRGERWLAEVRLYNLLSQTWTTVALVDTPLRAGTLVWSSDSRWLYAIKDVDAGLNADKLVRIDSMTGSVETIQRRDEDLQRILIAPPPGPMPLLTDPATFSITLRLSPTEVLTTNLDAVLPRETPLIGPSAWVYMPDPGGNQIMAINADGMTQIIAHNVVATLNRQPRWNVVGGEFVYQHVAPLLLINTASRWLIVDPERSRAVVLPTATQPWGMVLSPDETQLAYHVSSDSTLYIVDLPTARAWTIGGNDDGANRQLANSVPRIWTADGIYLEDTPTGIIWRIQPDYDPPTLAMQTIVSIADGTLLGVASPPDATGDLLLYTRRDQSAQQYELRLHYAATGQDLPIARAAESFRRNASLTFRNGVPVVAFLLPSDASAALLLYDVRTSQRQLLAADILAQNSAAVRWLPTAEQGNPALLVINAYNDQLEELNVYAADDSLQRSVIRTPGRVVAVDRGIDGELVALVYSNERADVHWINATVRRTLPMPLGLSKARLVYVP